MTIPVIIASIAFFTCDQCSSVSNNITNTFGLLSFVLVAGPFAASIALGAPAFAEYIRGLQGSTDWQVFVLKESPQTGTEYSLANNCAWSFVVFSFIFGVIYCIGCPLALPHLVHNSLEMIRERREQRRRRRGGEEGALNGNQPEGE